MDSIGSDPGAHIAASRGKRRGDDRNILRAFRRKVQQSWPLAAIDSVVFPTGALNIVYCTFYILPANLVVCMASRHSRDHARAYSAASCVHLLYSGIGVRFVIHPHLQHVVYSFPLYIQ